MLRKYIDFYYILEYLIGQNFVGQNFLLAKFSSLSQNFVNFVRAQPDCCTNILDKIFIRTEIFVGQNFRHQVEISSILSDEFLSDKVFNSISDNIDIMLD